MLRTKKNLYIFIATMAIIIAVLIFKRDGQTINPNNGQNVDNGEITGQARFGSEEIIWTAENLDLDDESAGQYINVTVSGTKYAIGEYTGCNTEPQIPNETGQVSYISCWFGGSGYEIAIFLEDGSYIVKERWIQEAGGPEVNAEPYGPWENLFSIN